MKIEQFNKWFESQLKTPEAIAERLAIDLSVAAERLRETKGWSYAELARRMDVSRQQVYKLMSGTQNCTIGSIVKLAEALGCEVEITLKPKTNPVGQQDKSGKSRPKSTRSRHPKKSTGHSHKTKVTPKLPGKKPNEKARFDSPGQSTMTYDKIAAKSKDG